MIEPVPVETPVTWCARMVVVLINDGSPQWHLEEIENPRLETLKEKNLSWRFKILHLMQFPDTTAGREEDDEEAEECDKRQ